MTIITDTLEPRERLLQRLTEQARDMADLTGENALLARTIATLEDGNAMGRRMRALTETLARVSADLCAEKCAGDTHAVQCVAAREVLG